MRHLLGKPLPLSTLKQPLLTACGVVALLLLWTLAARLVGAEIIVPPPERVLFVVWDYLDRSEFWLALGGTVLRVLTGFGISLALSLTLGVAAGVSDSVRALLRPLLATIAALPVLAVILILLIWFGSELVPVVTAVLMTLPVMTEAVIGGIRGVEPTLIEMARLYRVPAHRIVARIQLPSLLPALFSGAAASLGLTWKVVVAAEILAQPIRAVGTEMQDARVMLETASVFAWTVAALVLSAVSQAIFRVAARRWGKHGRRAS